MIYSVEGEIVDLNSGEVVLETAGVGYLIKISKSTSDALAQVTGKAKLFTVLQIREDSHTLIGFLTKAERHIYLMLTSVTGIGASTALSMLGTIDVTSIATAIGSGNVAALSAVKGVGAKTAQRIILELKEKVLKENPTMPVAESKTSVVLNNSQQDALLALMALGIPRNTAEKSIRDVVDSEGANLTVEQIIKLALRNSK